MTNDEEKCVEEISKILDYYECFLDAEIRLCSEGVYGNVIVKKRLSCNKKEE